MSADSQAQDAPARVPDSAVRACRYPTGAIVAQYIRATLGLAFTLVPLGLMQPAPLPGAALVAGGAFFLVYFAQAVIRQYTQIVFDEAGIWLRGPLSAAIPWEDLRAMHVKYYTTRHDRSSGWMHLHLRGTDGTISIDSTLPGFAQIAAVAARELHRQGRFADEATRFNLASLAIRLPEP